MVAVNNEGGRLPGFMVWDPAPNPPPLGPLFLPALYCSLHLSLDEARLLRETRQNNETIDRGLRREVPVQGSRGL